jgi:hypothetical protein
VSVESLCPGRCDTVIGPRVFGDRDLSRADVSMASAAWEMQQADRLYNDEIRAGGIYQVAALDGSEPGVGCRGIGSLSRFH